MKKERKKERKKYKQKKQYPTPKKTQCLKKERLNEKYLLHKPKVSRRNQRLRYKKTKSDLTENNDKKNTIKSDKIKQETEKYKVNF